MKRIILFVSLLLLTYVNSNAGNTPVGSPSALTADFSASVTSGCAPLVVAFTSTSTFNAGDPIVSYTWDFGDGTTITTPNATPTHTYTVDGFHTVTLTVTTQSSATHTTSKTDYIRAFEKLIPDFGPDVSICPGVNYLLDPNLPFGADSYTWSNPDWNVGTGYPGVNVQDAGLYWVEVAYGACTARDTIVVTTKPPVVVDFDYTVLNNCGNMEVQFNDLSSSCSGNSLSYTWYISDVDYNILEDYYTANPSHTFDTEGTYYIYLLIDDGEGSWPLPYKIDTINVAFSSGPTPPALGGPKNICEGSSVQLDAGSEPGATYVWTPATGLSSTSVYNPVASPLVTTTYTVTKSKCGIDAAPASVTVNVNPPLVVNLGPDQSMCPGGSLVLDAGITGATYQWGSTYSPAYSTMTSKTVVALGAGSYWVTVTKNGCVARDTIVITAKPAVDPMFTYTQTGFCGTLSVDFTDASIPCSGSIVNYVWDFGDGSPAVSGDNPTISHNYSTAGTYHVTLTVTTSGAVSDSYEQDIVVTGGAAPAVNLGPATAICAGSSITLDAGNPGATYSWSTGESTQTITVGTADTYTVTVTKDGCSASDAKTITVTPAPVVDLGPATAICAGSSITLDAGNPGATYSWSTGESTQTITVGTADTYTVTVTKDGCSASDAKTITVTPAPVVDLGPATAICAGSSITLDAGNPGATYSWSTGESTQTITVGTADTYTVTVTKDGCSASDAKTITVTPAPVVDLGPATAICAGSSITLDAGNPGATYSWSTGESTQTITVGTADTYTVTVTKDGCSASDAKTITVTPAPVVDLGPATAICAGSSITLDAGNPGATYSWSTGESTQTITVGTADTYTVTVTKDGCSASDAKTITVTPAPVVDLGPATAICAGSSITLDAGNPGATYSWSTGESTQIITVGTADTYTVTVTKDGCSASDAKTITVTPAPVVDLGPATAICAGSSITLDAGNPGATYSWSTGESTQTITVGTADTYTVTVTKDGCSASDAKTITVTPAPVVDLGPATAICAGSSITLDAGNPGATYSWSTGESTQTITVGTADTYTVTVTKDGCSASDAKTITVTPAPVVDLGPATAICAGSSITLDAGNPGATYSWSTGESTQTITVGTADTYTVTVTKDGCSASDAKTITVTPAPVVDLGPATAICAGSSITLDAGNPGATYSWSTGESTQIITVGTADTYTVTVTKDGCSASDAKTITVTPAPVVDLGPATAICAGSSITLDAGNPGATYSWSTGESTQIITVGTADTYTVTVTKDGCSASDAKTITVTPAPVVDLGPATAICAGSSITLDAGNPGATYSWSTGESTQTITVGTADTYTVTVTKDGCSASDAKTITVTPAPVVDLGPATAICAGSSITLDAGNPGATYSWSTGESTQTITVGTADTYTVTVTKDGCSASDAKTITVTPAPVVDLGPATAICAGSSITLDAGNPGATYSWSTGESTQTITVGTADTYTVTVTKDGCSASDAKTITVNTSGLVVDLGADIERCAIGLPATLDAGITGAAYKWGSDPFVSTVTNKTTKKVQTLTAGKFWVEVTKGGCSATDTIIVTNKPNAEPQFSYTQTGSCSPIEVSFTDATTSCSSISNYEWDFGDGSAVLTGTPDLAIKNPTHSYAQPGVYHVILKVTVSGEDKTYEEDIIVSGTGIPVNLGNDTTICAGSSITLDAGDHPGATYEWAPGGENTRSITVSTSDTYIVTVTKDGCKSIDAINVTVAPELTVDLGNDTTICAGNSVVLDAGNPGATYLWSTGETTRTIIADHADTYSVTVDNGTCTGTGSIKVDISSTLPVSLGNDATICTGSSITLDAGYPGAVYAWNTTATSQSITVNTAGIYSVTVNDNGCVGEDEIEISLMYTPSAVNLGNDTTICFGDMVKLDAGNPGAQYLWSTGAATQTIHAMSSGLYSVEVTSCGGTAYDEIYLTMANLPVPSITQSGNELIASEADTYQWYKDGVMIQGATGKKYKPRGYGKYKVLVTSTATGCSGESKAYFFVPDGRIYIGDIRVKLSPNPGSGLAKLVFSKLPPKPINVTVYDRVGRRILFTTMVNTVNDINLAAYAKGEYFVECILDDKRIIIPLVTQ